MGCGRTESLILGILSNIRSLKSAPNRGLFRVPLHTCIIFPLWIAGLHTEAGSESRTLLRQEFESFIAERGNRVDHMTWDILLEVWSRRESCSSSLSPMILADQFANEMEIELHLY